MMYGRGVVYVSQTLNGDVLFSLDLPQNYPVL